MVAPTVSNAKNRMRRVIDAIIDPWPRDEQPIWDHFGSACAYCGEPLERKGRQAHMDHATSGGGNHLGNLILSCGTCNGDEKRDEGWREFLQRKVADDDLRAERTERIESWVALHPPTIWSPSPRVVALEADLHALVDEFGLKCAELRTLVADERRSAEMTQGS